MSTAKSVVVLSGGMDSTTLLYYVAQVLQPHGEIYAITFAYGQKHSVELEMAKYQAKQVGVKEHKVLDITFLKDLLKGSSALLDEDIKVPHIKETLGDPQPPSYVPFRNSIFLTLALSWAEAKGAEVVYYGAQAHDTYSGYWDASPEFLPAINAVANLNRMHKIHIAAPFMSKKKNELLELGLDMHVDYSHTISCYNGVIPFCGTCPTCSDRIQAWRKIKRIDPVAYATAIPWQEWGCV